MLFDKLYQKVTGNKDAHTLFGGSIGMVARMFRAIDDIVSGRKNVVEGLLDMSSVTNWAPFTKEILQQVWNTDSFTNKPIAKPGTPDNMELALRASHAASGLFNPTMLFKDPARYLVKEPLGISEAKPFDTRPRTPRQARQEQLDQARQFRKLPSVLQGAVRATK
jgi:hypothetical protein